MWLFYVDNDYYVFHFVLFMIDVFNEFWISFHAYKISSVFFDTSYEIPIGSSYVMFVIVYTG